MRRNTGCVVLTTNACENHQNCLMFCVYKSLVNPTLVFCKQFQCNQILKSVVYGMSNVGEREREREGEREKNFNVKSNVQRKCQLAGVVLNAAHSANQLPDKKLLYMHFVKNHCKTLEMFI